MTYVLKSLSGGKNMVINRKGKDTLELAIGEEKVTAFTEDLASLVREELPKDRADEMFSEVQEKIIQKGKARIAVKASKNIRKDEMVVFTIDVSKYLDAQGKPSGLRTTESGFLF